MDNALRTAMSLEVLDKSKENYKKMWRSYDEPFEDEPRRKKEKMSRLGVNTVEAVEGVVKPESSEVAVTAAEGVGVLHEGDGGDAESFWDHQGSARTTECYSAEGEPTIFQSGSWCTNRQPQFQTTCAECTGSRCVTRGPRTFRIVRDFHDPQVLGGT